MEIELRQYAKQNIWEIASYIAVKQGYSAAQRFLDAVESSQRILGENPLCGPEDENGLLDGLRFKLIDGYHYKIFYVVEEGRVVILHVRSTYQNHLYSL